MSIPDVDWKTYLDTLDGGSTGFSDSLKRVRCGKRTKKKRATRTSADLLTANMVR